MVQWFVRSIPHGGPIEPFPVPASTTGVKGHGMCYPVCGDGTYKRSLAANRKK